MTAARRIAAAWIAKLGQNLWMDRKVSPKGVRYPKSKWDKLQQKPFDWATPATNIDGSFPEPWRVAHKDLALVWLKKMFKDRDIYTDYSSKKSGGKETIWVGLRDNRDKADHEQRIMYIFDTLRDAGWPVARSRGGYTHLFLVDDIKRDALR